MRHRRAGAPPRRALSRSARPSTGWPHGSATTPAPSDRPVAAPGACSRRGRCSRSGSAGRPPSVPRRRLNRPSPTVCGAPGPRRSISSSPSWPRASTTARAPRTSTRSTPRSSRRWGSIPGRSRVRAASPRTSIATRRATTCWPSRAPTRPASTTGRRNAQQGMGYLSAQHLQAIALAQHLARAVGSENMVLTGHSLGGGLASTASVATDVPAVTFNAAGVHPNTVLAAAALGHHDAGLSQGQIRNYHVRGEILTTLQNPLGSFVDHVPFVGDDPLPNALGTQIALNPAKGPDLHPSPWGLVSPVIVDRRHVEGPGRLCRGPAPDSVGHRGHAGQPRTSARTDPRPVGRPDAGSEKASGEPVSPLRPARRGLQPPRPPADPRASVRRRGRHTAPGADAGRARCRGRPAR